MINKDKIVCFAGHRDEWHCLNVEDKLKKVLIGLINQDYNVFYDGNRGAFDKKCRETVIELKKQYPHIKLVKVLERYNENKERFFVPACYDYTILADTEEVFPKLKIQKRNEWMIDCCDALVCHIEFTYKSGAYKTVAYAKKKNKRIIEI